MVKMTFSRCDKRWSPQQREKMSRISSWERRTRRPQKQRCVFCVLYTDWHCHFFHFHSPWSAINFCRRQMQTMKNLVQVKMMKTTWRETNPVGFHFFSFFVLPTKEWFFFSIGSVYFYWSCSIYCCFLSEDEKNTKVVEENGDTLGVANKVSPKMPKSPKLAGLTGDIVKSPKPRSKSPKSMSSVSKNCSVSLSACLSNWYGVCNTRVSVSIRWFPQCKRFGATSLQAWVEANPQVEAWRAWSHSSLW